MLVLSFSGTGENSITLKSLEVLEHHRDVEPFEKILIKPSFNYDEHFDEVIAKMKGADVIIWAVSPFHMNIQSHMLEFFERCRAVGLKLNNLNTFFITNVRVCDNFLQTILERQIRSIADYYVQGLSFAMNDMINKKMALYLMTIPDGPPKKGIFGGKSTPVYEEGEGLTTAVQWYKILKQLSSFVRNGDPVSFKPSCARKILFVNMDDGETSSFVLDAVNKLKDLYHKRGCVVSDINQRDFNVRPCDGCKICYASKVCKVKDNYLDYEKVLFEADTVIYYGRCRYGFTSSISKRMIDRGVHNGLMPVNGTLPSEMERFQSVGYILDADAESYAQYKDYQFALASFEFIHFLGVYSNVPGTIGPKDLELMYNYSLLLMNERMLPQRNFWTEKVGRHFSDLSQNIPNILPDEVKYYKRAGGYEPVPVELSAHTITPETVNIGAKMRLTPYDKVIEALDKKYNG